MPRVQLLLTAAMLAFTAGACGDEAETDGGGGAGSCPQHDVRIMAPADPGGGWDSTAREMAEALRKSKVIDKGVEVYNVPGAGGTIGLSQLASKRAGQSNEIMVMGLVMPGAILTNDSPVDRSKTTPIAALTTEPEAIAVRSQSPPRPALTSAILVLATLGVYSISGSVTEVLIM
jgi:putative tricarboxylic transport membrane protein